MNWRRMPFVGRERGIELIYKLAAAQKLSDIKDGLAQLYTILTILNTKATGLLTVNAFLIAGLVASADQIKYVLGFTPPPVILRAQLVTLGVSAFLCMLVVRVTWKFMWYVPESASSAADFEAELSHLANAIADRTHYYWCAWFAALVGILMSLAWWHRWIAWLALVIVIVWIRRRG